MVARTVLPVCVILLALIIKTYSQSQFLRWCVQENGMCHQNWECCDQMTCSDHFGIGKCIPLTTYPVAWPPAVSVPWYGPCPILKPKTKKKKKKTKTKILIKVAGDLTGLTVKAKKKNDLLKA